MTEGQPDCGAVCWRCAGKGWNNPATSAETQGPRRDAERQWEASLIRVPCSQCAGTGKTPVPPTGRVELGERSNTDPQPTTTTTTSATSQAAGLPPTPRSVEAEGAPDRGADKDRTSPAAVVDYTERARALVNDAGPLHSPSPWHVVGSLDAAAAAIANAFSAVASEHQAEIEALKRAIVKAYADALRVKTALRARLQEPDEELIAAAQAAYIAEHAKVSTTDAKAWRAALTKIAEMLK